MRHIVGLVLLPGQQNLIGAWGTSRNTFDLPVCRLSGWKRWARMQKTRWSPSESESGWS